jgi:hypothetical protein
MSHVASIYLGALPEPIQRLFPKDDLDTLVVFFSCQECYGDVATFAYRGEELDRLVLCLDGSVKFNEPRVLLGWKEGQMYPPDWSDSMLGNAIECRFVFRDLYNHIKYQVSGVRSQPDLTWAGGYPVYTQNVEQPTVNSRLVMHFEEGQASTAMWGDCGTAHFWTEVGEDYGLFKMTWACC